MKYQAIKLWLLKAVDICLDFTLYKDQQFHNLVSNVQFLCRLGIQMSSSFKKYFMGFAKEVLNSIWVKNAKRKSRLLIIFLRILKSVSLLLNSLKFREQVFSCVFYAWLSILLLTLFFIFFNQICKNCMINRQSLQRIQLFNKL